MNMKAQLFKGIAAVGMMLLIGMNAQAQCTLTANIFSDTIACNGMLAGIGPQVSGGSGDYSYLWSPAFAMSDPTAQSPLINASFPQWISVTVTDNGTGCTASDSVMYYPNIQQNQTVNLCNGPAVLTLDPGSMIYAWTATDPTGGNIDMSGVTGNSFSATEAGTYVVMTYYSACNQVFHEFEVVSTVNVSLLRDTVYTCTQGFCDASATAFVSGGVEPYSFQWNTGHTTSTVTGLCPGPYSVAVTDVNGCTAESMVTVLDGPPPVQSYSITSTVSYENCEADLCLSLPEGIIDHLWFVNGAPSPTVEHCLSDGWLLNGDQVVLLVVDSFGCTHSTPMITIEVPSAPSLSASLFEDSIACNGTLFIGPTVSGGSGDYSYQWSPSFAVNDPTAQGVQIQQSFPLWVTVTVTDNQTGCTASDSVFVSPNIQVNQTVSLCNGPAELTLDPGSMVYNWTATDPDGGTIDMSGVTGNSFSATQAGTYQVMTYYSGCNQVFHEFVVDMPFTVGFAMDVVYTCTQDACDASSTVIVSNGTGPFTYQWDTPNSQTTATATLLCPGSIQVIVTDANGCMVVQAATVMFGPPPTGFPEISMSVSYESCEAEVCFMASDGFESYSWYANAAPLTVGPQWCNIQGLDLSGITLAVVGTDVFGCEHGSPPYEPNLVEVGLSVGIANSADSIACNGTLFIGPTVSGGSGDYSYQWSPSFAVNDPTAQGVQIQQSFPLWVTVTVTDNETGCTASDSVFVSPNIQQNQTLSLCNGPAELTLDPGSMVYNWTAIDPDGGTIDMSGVTGSSFSATEAGTYTVMTYYSACNQVFHEFEVTDEFDFLVADTIFVCPGVCDGYAVVTALDGTFLNGSVLWDGWNTAYAMDNMCAGVYTVEVWSLLNGCYRSKQVVVLEHPIQEFSIADSSSSFIMMNDVGYGICLWATPGFSPYVWSNGSMGQFICVSHTPSSPMQDWLAAVSAADSFGCWYQDSYLLEFPFWGDDVWPGDVNYDGVANNTDMLYLGLNFGHSDFERPQATLDWMGQPSLDWNMFISGVNANPKHADTDGNGTVNFADTVAISLNYGQTHGKTENALAGNIPAVWVQAVPDTVAPGGGVVATVHLGTAAQPVDSLHGIAFTLTFNDLLVDDADFTIDFSGNVLGTVGSDVMTLRKLFFPDGEVDVAVTRNTLQNFGGFGPLATFHIVTTDNLSGIHKLRIGVSGVTAITAHGHAVELATVADTVIIDPEYVSIGEAFGANLHIYPNPTDGIVRVDGLQGTVAVEVLDATGRVISRSGNNGSASLTLDLSGRPAGFYLLRLSGVEGVAVRRVVKGW